MNEQYSHENEPANLSALEVQSLVNQAKLQGEKRDVDFAYAQAADKPQPYHYVVELDPAPLQAYKDSLPNAGFETITSVVVEYNDEYITDNSDEPPSESVVSVSIVSDIANAIDANMIVKKGTDYELPLNPIQDSTVAESYFDADGNHLGFVAGQGAMATAQQFADERRPLNDDDLQLLRVIV